MTDVEGRRQPAAITYVISSSALASLLIVVLLVIPVPQVVRAAGVAVLTALTLAASLWLARARRTTAVVVPGGTRVLASATTFWGLFTGGMFLLSVVRGRPHPVEAVIGGLLAGAFFAAVMYWTCRDHEQRQIAFPLRLLLVA